MTIAIVYLGSRAASVAALAFFALLFGTLGLLVGRRLDRGGLRPKLVPRLCGWIMFLVPMVLIYASSLSGFYEAEVVTEGLLLRYLVPSMTTLLPAASVSGFEPQPAYRGSWQLRVITGERYYDSATTQRSIAADAVDRLQAEWRQRH